MDDQNSQLNKETIAINSKNDKNIENKTKPNTEIKQHRDIENTINAMLDQVMEDPDDTNSNSNHIINSLQFNDDESNEDGMEANAVC